MDIEAETDSDSVVEEKSDNRRGKRKHWISLQIEDKQVKKKKDSGPSSSHKKVMQDHDNNTIWKLVQSKKDKKEQVREQHLKQLLKQLLSKPNEPRLKPKKKKPRTSPPKPNALIICLGQKDSYANILDRIKKDVPMTRPALRYTRFAKQLPETC